jgi:ActR/RegA family two-component response regulator
MTRKILFVDDEAAVLDGYRRSLQRDFEITTATGGTQGLAAIRGSGPFAVVVSDMRMPTMTGAKFLAQVRTVAPDSVRMLLTGYADLNAAIEAVNEGHVFRFLTKPCAREVLTAAIVSGMEQYQLVTAERELLEQTLMGSIKVLTDVLSATSPEAFGRSIRIGRYVDAMVGRLGLKAPWRFKAAAALSQLGCITLTAELLQQAYSGDKLSAENQERYNVHPEVASRLLAHVPRLEPVAWMISQQLVKDIPGSAPGMTDSACESVVVGAKLLKLAVALEDLKMKGVSQQEAALRLESRRAEFGPELLDSLGAIKPDSSGMELRKCSVSRLAVGMILQQELRNSQSGMLMIPKGHEITAALSIKLEHYSREGMIVGDIMVMAPAN